MNWVMQLHRGSWGGAPGKIMMSFIAILIVLMWPTGVILRRLRLHKGVPARTRPRPVRTHRVSGLVAGALITWMAISGSTLNFKKELTRLFDPEPTVLRPHARRDSLSALALNQSMKIATHEKPDLALESIRFQKGPILLFFFSDTSRVYIDPNTHAVLKVTAPTSHWVQALFPFHSGRALGPLRLPYILTVGSLGLLITLSGGFLLWRPRRNRTSWAAAKLHKKGRAFEACISDLPYSHLPGKETRREKLGTTFLFPSLSLPSKKD